MRATDFVNLLDKVNDKYILEAAEYKSNKKQHWIIKWKAIAACFLIVAVIGGIIPFLNKAYISPFIISAYAYEGDAVGSELSEKEAVPVSVFQTSSGLNCFVFSSNKLKDTSSSAPTISIINTDDYAKNIGEILGLTPKAGQSYYIYVIEDTAEPPHSFSLYLPDEENNKVCQYNVSITESNGDYVAKLLNMGTHEITEEHIGQYISEKGMYVFDENGEIVFVGSHPSKED